MIIIFDLDYTLLDTSAFKNKLASALGITQKEFQETYNRLKHQKETYNFGDHLNSVSNLKTINKKKAVDNLNILLKGINRFAYKDAEIVLKKLFKKKYKLILLTYGNKNWQRMKIKNLKIKKYFKKIIFTDTCKSHALDFLKTVKEKIVFVNDNAKECKKIKKIYPSLEIFLIDGKYSKNTKHNFKVHKLKDLIKYT